jgi:cytosine/adenosine deaminase-related metal-dependent hydrolase
MQLVTAGGAQAIAASADYGLAPGSAANLVLVEASEPGEMVTVPAVKRLVIQAGKLVGKDSD